MRRTAFLNTLVDGGFSAAPILNPKGVPATGPWLKLNEGVEVLAAEAVKLKPPEGAGGSTGTKSVNVIKLECN